MSRVKHREGDSPSGAFYSGPARNVREAAWGSQKRIYPQNTQNPTETSQNTGTKNRCKLDVCLFFLCLSMCSVGNPFSSSCPQLVAFGC